MSNVKILVVDDDKNICELIGLYLKKEGFAVEYAYDGEEALARFKSFSPDLLVLDLMLPKLDGISVCREIRASSNVPIIMLTAKGETFDKVLGLEMGADDYIVKPFETKELSARVKAVLRRYYAADSVAHISKRHLVKILHSFFTVVYEKNRHLIYSVRLLGQRAASFGTPERIHSK